MWHQAHFCSCYLYPSTCSMNKNEQLTVSKFCPQEPCCFLLPHSHTISQFLYKEGKRQLPSDNSILYCHHQQCNEFRLKIESYWVFHEGIQFTFDQKKVSDFERYCKSTYIQVLQSTHMHLKQKLLSKEIRKFRDSFRAQSYTFLMEDLCQDINRVSSLSRFLNGRFH